MKQESGQGRREKAKKKACLNFQLVLGRALSVRDVEGELEEASIAQMAEPQPTFVHIRLTGSALCYIWTISFIHTFLLDQANTHSVLSPHKLFSPLAPRLFPSFPPDRSVARNIGNDPVPPTSHPNSSKKALYHLLCKYVKLVLEGLRKVVDGDGGEAGPEEAAVDEWLGEVVAELCGVEIRVLVIEAQIPSSHRPLASRHHVEDLRFQMLAIHIHRHTSQ